MSSNYVLNEWQARAESAEKERDEAKARAEQAELAWQRILACHEDDAGRCFDCRKELVRLCLVEGVFPESEPPEWTKYFNAVNRVKELEAVLNKWHLACYEREREVEDAETRIMELEKALRAIQSLASSWLNRPTISIFTEICERAKKILDEELK